MPTTPRAVGRVPRRRLRVVVHVGLSVGWRRTRPPGTEAEGRPDATSGPTREGEGRRRGLRSARSEDRAAPQAVPAPPARKARYALPSRTFPRSRPTPGRPSRREPRRRSPRISQRRDGALVGRPAPRVAIDCHSVRVSSGARSFALARVYRDSFWLGLLRQGLYVVCTAPRGDRCAPPARSWWSARRLVIGLAVREPPPSL